MGDRLDALGDHVAPEAGRQPDDALQDGQVVGRFGSANVAFAAPQSKTLLTSR